MVGEYQIEIGEDLFFDILDIGKKVKSHYIICNNASYGIVVYGLDTNLCCYKTIQDDTHKLDCKSLPIDMAVCLSDLSKIAKEEGPIFINIIEQASMTFFKSISRGEYESSHVDCIHLGLVLNKITREMAVSRSLVFKELTDSEEFISMLNTKSEDGLSVLHIDGHLIYASPSLVNVQNGDEISICVGTANIGKLINFVVKKKKKKCTVYTTLRVIDIRKQC